MKISNHKKVISRRTFIKTSGLVMGGSVVQGFPAITSAKSPNSKLNIGCIGVGGRGGHNSNETCFRFKLHVGGFVQLPNVWKKH